jgi:hypothetical protein
MKEKDEDFFRFSSSNFDSFSLGTCYSKYIEKRNTQTIGGMKHEKNNYFIRNCRIRIIGRMYTKQHGKFRTCAKQQLKHSSCLIE